MAKKRKKGKEEEYEFKAPEFDEEEFVRKELRDAKAILITIAYAVIIAFISYLLMFTDILLSFLLGLLAVVFLRHIYPFLKIDTSTFEIKNWLGNGVMYFFTWLALWILLVNPPISDFSDPRIDDAHGYVGSPGEWLPFNDTTKVQLEQGMNLSIGARVVDNTEIKTDGVKIMVTHNETLITGPSWATMTKEDDDYYFFIISESDTNPGRYQYNITATDKNGNKASFSGQFIY
jgi:hypothetical protein